MTLPLKSTSWVRDSCMKVSSSMCGITYTVAFDMRCFIRSITYCAIMPFEATAPRETCINGLKEIFPRRPQVDLTMNNEWNSSECPFKVQKVHTLYQELLLLTIVTMYWVPLSGFLGSSCFVIFKPRSRALTLEVVHAPNVSAQFIAKIIRWSPIWVSWLQINEW